MNVGCGFSVAQFCRRMDFYQYACGGWKKNNPIPPDQTSWDVYRKLYEDNLRYLRSILEQAASLQAGRDAVTRQIGDFYAACMDESRVEKRGLSGLESELNAIARLRSTSPMVSSSLIFNLLMAAPFFSARARRRIPTTPSSRSRNSIREDSAFPIAITTQKTMPNQMRSGTVMSGMCSASSS